MIVESPVLEDGVKGSCFLRIEETELEDRPMVSALDLVGVTGSGLSKYF